MTIETTLKEIFGDRLKLEEPMSKYTNFRIGGPAKFFVEVKSVDELKFAVSTAVQNGAKVFVFGGGSNMLVSDHGFDGLAIKMALREVTINGNRVRAEAGVLSAGLARITAKAGLAGFTWAISLPGTIGGAVRGNAGCFGGETRDHLVEVEVFRNGDVVTVPASELKFAYRESMIKHNNDIVIAATFMFEPGDSPSLLKDLDEKLASRKSSQPLDAGSAGCLFKNYEVHSDEELQRLAMLLDIPIEMSTARRLPAGWLIDHADLKGLRIGDAQVSDKHANFLVNRGHATADEVLQVISVIKTRIRNTFGVQLQEEVQYICN